MRVGIHAVDRPLSPVEIEQIRELDPNQTRVFLNEDQLEAHAGLADDGVQIRLAQPDLSGMEGKTCKAPSEMIFVNPQGVLFTCGMVEGNESYRLGSIFETRIDHMAEDTSLPRSVPCADATRVNGCDGCPPMLARFLLHDD